MTNREVSDRLALLSPSLVPHYTLSFIASLLIVIANGEAMRKEIKTVKGKDKERRKV